MIPIPELGSLRFGHVTPDERRIERAGQHVPGRPSVRDGVMRLSRAQFEALFESLDWSRMWRPAVPRPLTAG